MSMQTFCTDFINNFLKYFFINSNGRIQINYSTWEAIQHWLSDTNSIQLIFLTTQKRLDVYFNPLYMGQWSTCNKQSIWNVFCTCRDAYYITCETCHQPMDTEYHSITIDMFDF